MANMRSFLLEGMSLRISGMTVVDRKNAVADTQNLF